MLHHSRETWGPFFEVNGKCNFQTSQLLKSRINHPPATPTMASRRLDRTLSGLARRPLTCLFCEARRSFTTSTLRPARKEKPGAGASLDPQANVAKPIEAPRSYGKRQEGQFVPKPLPRPIGMPLPPKAGENTGIDSRTLSQRREDFVNYDKHLQRRKEL